MKKTLDNKKDEKQLKLATNNASNNLFGGNLSNCERSCLMESRRDLPQDIIVNYNASNVGDYHMAMTGIAIDICRQYCSNEDDI